MLSVHVGHRDASPIDYEQSLDAAPEAARWLDKLGVERRTPAAVLAAELHGDRTG